jgi:hypothetical protein
LTLSRKRLRDFCFRISPDEAIAARGQELSRYSQLRRALIPEAIAECLFAFESSGYSF